MNEENNGYTLDKVGWHTQVPNNPEPKERIIRRFWIIINFLQENNLMNSKLLNSEFEVNDDTSIHTSVLTDMGRILMKKYNSWLTGIDKGKSVEDIKIFERELKKLKNSTA